MSVLLDQCKNATKIYVLAVGALLLTACGGGSDSDSIPPDPVNISFSIVGPSQDTALVDESVGLVLKSDGTNLTNIVWSQTSGTSVEFLGANRKVIGFDVPAADNYSFSVSFNDASGARRTADYSFSATDESPVYVNARLDHEANARSKMSLHAYSNLPGELTTVTWAQTSGISASLTATDTASLNFIAPNVSRDSILEFEVTMSDDLGNQASDTVKILLEPETIDSDSHFVDGRFADHSLADVYSYNSNSQYASSLERCIYSNTTTDYCDLSELPFLGTVDSTPSVASIMDRVLVSHDWMGERFEDFLTNVDVSNDIKNLLGATRSIVISYDIRPSFFWAGTGAIYINASYFWVTVGERDTLDTAPDFRSNFDSELQFADPWRIVLNNEYAYSTPNRSSRLDRPVDDYKLYALRVMYHELAHANDYFPPRAWQNARGSDFPWTYSDNNEPDSTGLEQTLPLTSSQMYGLGNVLFQGENATSTQSAYTPSDVSGFFFPDDANNTYNYSTSREDYATLAEEYMMSYRFGVMYDQGITGKAPDYTIDTAERGRVGHSRITTRAEYVIARILPSINTAAASASLNTPIVLTSGVSWRDALVAPGAMTKQRTSKKAYTTENEVLLGSDFHPHEEIKIRKPVK